MSNVNAKGTHGGYFKMTNKILTKEFISNILKTTQNFENILKKVEIISASNGNCVAELKIEKEHSNSTKTLHGGLSATLVDSISTYGLATHERVGSKITVSLELHLTFLKGAAIGQKVQINSKTVRAGRTIAFLEVSIFNKQTKELLVKGSHTKFIKSG